MRRTEKSRTAPSFQLIWYRDGSVHQRRPGLRRRRGDENLLPPAGRIWSASTPPTVRVTAADVLRLA